MTMALCRIESCFEKPKTSFRIYIVMNFPLFSWKVLKTKTDMLI